MTSLGIPTVPLYSTRQLLRDQQFATVRVEGEAKPPRERHADMFAAALLMPRKQLSKDFRRLAKDGYTDQITATLARQYGVSEDAMRFRLMNLNALLK